MRKAYIQGLVQRRVKYRVDLDKAIPVESFIKNAATYVESIAAEWSAAICPPTDLPSLALFLVDYMGAHLPADLFLCAPISHPMPPGIPINVPFTRFDICLEPIAPMAPPSAFIALKTHSVKELGRITLRDRYAVVKYRGLLFVTAAHYRGEPKGGIELQLARYSCFKYNLIEALKSLKKILQYRS